MADVNNYSTDRGDSNSAGWVIAVILILILLIGGYFAFARTDTTTTDTLNTDTTGMDTSAGAMDTSGNGGVVGSMTVTSTTTTVSSTTNP